MDNLEKMYNSLDAILTDSIENNFEFSSHLDSQYLNLIYCDDLEYAEEMFELFLQTTSSEIDSLIKNMQEKNHSAVYQVAHKVKPTFTMVGLSEASITFESIEAEAISGIGKYDGFVEDVKQIQHYNIPLVRQELQRIRKSRSL